MSKYSESIKKLAANVPTTIVDFSIPRERANTPTQVSSNFITNREQGDWAEVLLLEAINQTAKNHIAVKYGKSDDVVAGESGFSEFYSEFQEELDTIGKRPDILIFNLADYDKSLGTDISQVHRSKLTEYVKKARAGIEVRSSAFLSQKYDAYMSSKIQHLSEEFFKIKNEILTSYKDILEAPAKKKYIPVLEAITPETISISSFKVPGWTASPRAVELNTLFKRLKSNLVEIQKRDFLSITPKVEDIKVVYKWIETFNVPHFYFQVFFDRIYGIPFSGILEIVSDEKNEDVIFFVERDNKNQNKQTIKINPKSGMLIAGKVEEPEHASRRREMDRGRLLFYVTFKGGRAYLDIGNICKVLNITEKEL